MRVGLLIYLTQKEKAQGTEIWNLPILRAFLNMFLK
jgi:hypothetical protein